MIYKRIWVKKTFEQARNDISNKYSYLELLIFNGTKNSATFLDKEFGIFIGNYSSVFYGKKNHRKRAKINFNKKIKNNIKNIKDKRKQTNLTKYGVENPFQLDEIKNKIKQTNLIKYGFEHSSQNSNIKNKIKATNLKRYGVENPQQNKVIQIKTQKTNIKKYGVKFVLDSKQIRFKISKKITDNYGVDNVLKNKKIQYNIQSKFRKKYGVSYPFKSKDIQRKVLKSKIGNCSVYNIDGYSLSEYYRNNLKSIIAYTTAQQNYKKYGAAALQKEYYNKLFKQSKIANLWLESIEKKLGYAILREYHIPNTKYHADGYDSKTNTIYEFYGDFWHGNLEKFSSKDIHPIKNITYKELYNNTINRQNKILKLGYNIIYMWEDNFKC